MTLRERRAAAAGFVELLTLKVSGETMVHQGNFFRKVFACFVGRHTYAKAIARALGLPHTALVPKQA